MLAQQHEQLFTREMSGLREASSTGRPTGEASLKLLQAVDRQVEQEMEGHLPAPHAILPRHEGLFEVRAQALVSKIGESLTEPALDALKTDALEQLIIAEDGQRPMVEYAQWLRDLPPNHRGLLKEALENAFAKIARAKKEKEAQDAEFEVIRPRDFDKEAEAWLNPDQDDRKGIESEMTEAQLYDRKKELIEYYNGMDEEEVTALVREEDALDEDAEIPLARIEEYKDANMQSLLGRSLDELKDAVAEHEDKISASRNKEFGDAEAIKEMDENEFVWYLYTKNEENREELESISTQIMQRLRENSTVDADFLEGLQGDFLKEPEGDLPIDPEDDFGTVEAKCQNIIDKIKQHVEGTKDNSGRNDQKREKDLRAAFDYYFYTAAEKEFMRPPRDDDDTPIDNAMDIIENLSSSDEAKELELIAKNYWVFQVAKNQLQIPPTDFEEVNDIWAETKTFIELFTKSEPVADKMIKILGLGGIER